MALKIALDTNCCRDFCAGDREVLDCVQLAERVVLPFVTLAELRAVFRYAIAAAAAAEGFGDPLHLSWLDERFSVLEERWVTVGQTGTGLTLTVADLFFDKRGEGIVRLISARRATQRERQAYEETT